MERLSLLSETKTKLFEDEVVMRPSGMSTDPMPFTLTVMEILKTYSMGKETISLLLCAVKGHGVHQQSSLAFSWNLSDVRFTFIQVSLKMQIAKMEPNDEPKTWTVLLKTQEQLSSWAAEVMQYKDWMPNNYKEEFYHVLWPCEMSHTSAVLLCSHGCLLVANPLVTATDVYSSWKAKDITQFEIDLYHQRQLVIEDIAGGRKTICLLNSRVAQRVVQLLQSLISDHCPKATVERVKGNSAVLYKIKHPDTEMKISHASVSGVVTLASSSERLASFSPSPSSSSYDLQGTHNRGCTSGSSLAACIPSRDIVQPACLPSLPLCPNPAYGIPANRQIGPAERNFTNSERSQLANVNGGSAGGEDMPLPMPRLKTQLDQDQARSTSRFNNLA